MKTFLALAEEDGEPLAAWLDAPWERPACEGGGAGPYELISNAKDAFDLLAGFEDFEQPPIAPREPRSGLIRPPELAALVRSTGAEPTPARMREAREAVRVWGAPETLSCRVRGVVPVADLAVMARDLKAVCSVYAYSIDECGRAMLERNLSDGLFLAECELEGVRSHRSLYGAHLARNPQAAVLQGFPAFRTPGEAAATTRLPVLDLPEEDAKRECAAFGRAAFNTLMADASPYIAADGFFSACGGLGWGRAYAHFAHVLCSGRAAVCDYCGDVFNRRRSTKQYCSNSCKVAASRAAASRKANDAH